MTLSPGYGETPLDPEEQDALTPAARAVVGDPPLKAAIYDIEQQVEQAVAEELIRGVLDRSTGLDELLAPAFAFDLHRRLYGAVWLWAGKPRTRLLNIGVDPSQVQVEVRATLDNLAYRWAHNSDWSAREFAIAVHAELVRIHPFVDGNGRTTRLLADLVLLAAQDSDVGPAIFNWTVEKEGYIKLLRVFDQNRDPRALAEFIELTTID